ncbi:putative DNA-binding transcriptional regulator AlpA [Lipingzhangella halophila]|uniref:Putative DNA-binding transcriptional regulator AlpA n=1 Tax=Lipingzhangella halophila TaxID=1783352 RepID=A0A7W7RGU4_9ACTN|nr:DNA-binding protein [Lipingzhangella halophila]MBB4931746.1 putative DNA-binding transcriptional regulator AlpA [Lipingzhangella halophila]
MESQTVPTGEAARILGVDARTVYYYARDYADFPEPGRFGSALVWDVQQLKDWRAKHPIKPKRND